MKCSLCSSEAIYRAEYNQNSYCRDHFSEMIERRFKREIRRQMQLGRKKTTVTVALSGGKDSSVTLYLMKKTLGNRNNTTIKAITVDEGISGYRSSGLESARKLCSSLGVEHQVISFSDTYKTTMDSMVKKNPAKIPCSMCGPMRRDAMNTIAGMVDSDYLALGLNLDDYAQTVLMNVARGDIDRMLRMAPHSNRITGLVPRILPLIRIPEKEVLTYAISNGVIFDSSWCPYYSQAQRNLFREIVVKLEHENPGTRFAIANFAESLKDQFSSRSQHDVKEIGKCSLCGKPSSSEICPVCQNLVELP